ncbi:P-loop containing nucleoside triphosphate hydrolase protein [Lasiosphaeria miniovina]|uniref:P-loop containing nucleoside triphosphate hydrolase protein n=1 Tax=Lasiosphaeria miniovina TaxID=1954250 RepID=A0AA40AKD5_9PEZI|nr:P-loop containing nucleoside triphosphate hydrolase protein [Lasiosphaeria miniovina]KAK0717372.1 P-loop containing nucleoside triphosphate hydrolase protein [Lasiosphaeria miniovina]
MALHSALLRGNGFYDWMTWPAQNTADLVELMAGLGLTSRVRALPVVSFLSIDVDRIDALLEEALPLDRTRFNQYLSKRVLGLGIITAGPGFGNTTALSVATLGMQRSLGQVLYSAPSHVATSKFAECLDRVSTTVTDRHNERQPSNRHTRYALVIRGYVIREELAAVSCLLARLAGGEDYCRQQLGKASNWRLHLSLAFWTLVVLGSPTVRSTRAHEAKIIGDLQAEITANPGVLHELRRVVVGGKALEEFQSEGHDLMAAKTATLELMRKILARADLLCTTLAAADKVVEYRSFKTKLAKGVSIDEAANMNRCDSVSLWGNTLLPCLLGGDPMQLPPFVGSAGEKDSSGHVIHRLAEDAAISHLDVLHAAGMPVYRLTQQLRMAEGLFDMVAKEAYPSADFTYAPSCAVGLDKFDIGHDLEKFLLGTLPRARASPTGRLSPFFVHVSGSVVEVDALTGSRRSATQVKAALKLAQDFVQTGVGARRIVILAPYSSNVALIERGLREPEFSALSAMAPVSTVDGYQGQESDIVFVVMGTSQASGPGFMANENRLTVLLSRQRCGLVIVGDIDVIPRQGPKGKDNDRFLVEVPGGQIFNAKVDMLRNIHNTLLTTGRVGYV